jgi:hypothetical protein
LKGLSHTKYSASLSALAPIRFSYQQLPTPIQTIWPISLKRNSDRFIY